MRIAALIAAAALVALGPAAAFAQDWPTRPVTMIAPFAAGGPLDALARILQPALGDARGQPIIIENVPGGGDTTGSLRVSQAAWLRI
jgi:tripartite-type tricarboxylate transporter receptor subunit TctC